MTRWIGVWASAGLLGVRLAGAADYTWTGAGNGTTWEDAAHWGGGG